MKKFSKLIGFIVVFMVMMATMCTVSFAATVGQQLTSPGAGWQRINDSDTNITYSSDYTYYTGYSYSTYFGDMHYTKSPQGTIKFNFTGTKLRILVMGNFDRSTDNHISIDGGQDKIFFCNSSTIMGSYLVYEIKDLSDIEHSVVIKCGTTNEYKVCLDAIDISSNGSIKKYNAVILSVKTPTNLTSNTSNKQVSINWDTVSDTTSYNIYRSKTSGSGYIKIGSTTSGAITTYTDTGLNSGTTYYYIVTAVNASGESVPSNEVSATITEPTAKNQLKLVLEVNENKLLSISDELSDNNEMSWTSSNPTIATVGANGIVKALKSGNTVITCTSKDKSYTESINVLVADLQYQLAVDLNVGDKCRLTVDDLSNATNVTWTAYDSTIATVTSKGKVTAVSEGLTYLVASDKDGKEIGRIYIRVRK